MTTVEMRAVRAVAALAGKGVMQRHALGCAAKTVTATMVKGWATANLRPTSELCVACCTIEPPRKSAVAQAALKHLRGCDQGTDGAGYSISQSTMNTSVTARPVANPNRVDRADRGWI